MPLLRCVVHVCDGISVAEKDGEKRREIMRAVRAKLLSGVAGLDEVQIGKLRTVSLSFALKDISREQQEDIQRLCRESRGTTRCVTDGNMMQSAIPHDPANWDAMNPWIGGGPPVDWTRSS